jgi:hypothetical protein
VFTAYRTSVLGICLTSALASLRSIAAVWGKSQHVFSTNRNWPGQEVTSRPDQFFGSYLMLRVRSYQVIVSDQICMLAPSRVSDHAACTTPSGPETS